MNIITLIPFCLCWTFAQITNNRIVKELLEILAFILAIFYAYMAMYSLGVEDSLFHLESFLFLMIFPLIAFLFYLERRNYRNAIKKEDLDDILDSGIDF